ncbi:hypothetical protein [Posidoniimonas polymericola]|uniref:hypothetical protein n=1 Tax=Posidoniimonas polymericola TaxID=2528002 RepID=UPI0011B5F5D1|nr:hypothetical protein [Posidoniimonas polymericola]
MHPDTFGTYNASVGEWFGPGLTAIVLPFQIPNLGAVADPFTDANLGVMVHEIGTGPTTTDVDLYAVRRDPNPAIITDDYYNGSAPDPTPGVVLIQESFLTPSSPAGFVGAPNNFTDTTGDSSLLNYLNDAYDGGAGAGDYVFLRLSYGADDFATVYDAYKITMREAGQQGEWPVLTLGTVAIPGDTDGNGLVEYPQDFDPILDNWRETNDTFGTTLARTDGDLNVDGVVNISDFREWKDAYLGLGGSPELVLQAFFSLGVPEPTAALLGAMGLAGMIGAGRRRN